MPDVDVLVIGAGIAGATIARLLAEWGHSVLLLRGPGLRHRVAESLPPSINNILERTGIRAEVERAGFYAATGNTSWWTGPEVQVESYPEGMAGYHVERHEFDALLVSLAERAGAKVQRNRRAPTIDMTGGVVKHDGGVTKSRFVVGASGRTGLFARQRKRHWDTRYKTIGLGTTVRRRGGWEADPHHTLIEAYETGWAWSVPLAADRRFVSFMVDSAAVKEGIDVAYRTELDCSEQFRSLFAGCEFEEAPWGRDATLYHADEYAGANWMLVGDAASFVEPLSSFGVKKAMISAWTGAVVVNTCLKRPAMAEAAISLFNARETETWQDHTRRAAEYFAEAAEVFRTPFWTSRARPQEGLLYSRPGLEAALEELRRQQHVEFVLSKAVYTRPAAAICGREVKLVDRLVLPGLEHVEYMQGIHLPTLASMAPGHQDVGALYAAYAEDQDGAQLPQFLAALSLLVDKQILRLRL